MNESDISAETDLTPPAKISSIAVWVSLILGAGLAGGGYYVWHLLNNTLSQQQDAISTLQQQISQLSDTAQTHNQLLADSAKHAQSLQEMAQQAIDLGNRKQKGWLLAEVDYLMRMANHRLQIARDINSAIVALQNADQGLLEAGDLSLLPVRQQLAKELAALKALHQVDIDGMVLALDQISDHIADLPFKPVEEIVRKQLPDVATDAQQPAISWSDRILDTIMAIGDIKIHQRSVKSSNEQLQYQSAHLLLDHLTSARLAALRFDNKQFSYNITQAQQILNTHYDAHDNRVTQMARDLATFSRVDLAPAMPDISASWRLLQTARAKTGDTQK